MPSYTALSLDDIAVILTLLPAFIYDWFEDIKLPPTHAFVTHSSKALLLDSCQRLFKIIGGYKMPLGVRNPSADWLLGMPVSLKGLVMQQ